MTAPDPTAAIVIIGAEVLAGKVEDENGPFLLRKFRHRGIRLTELRIIDDNEEVIIDAVRALSPKVTWLFTTGGIGPTHDDVTVPAIAAAFGVKVVHHPDLLRRVVRRYGEGPGAHLRLAEVPEGAVLHAGGDSGVPAIGFRNLFIFPGVPSLMRLCFAQIEASLGSAPLFSRALLLDASESAIAALLSRVQASHPEVAIGSYPRFDDAGYRVKVTIDGRADDVVRKAQEEIRGGLDSQCIVGEL